MRGGHGRFARRGKHSLIEEEFTMKKLRKSSTQKIIAGVCGGIGEYFNVDPTLIRLGFVALSFMFGGGLLVYIIAAIVIPSEEQ